MRGYDRIGEDLRVIERELARDALSNADAFLTLPGGLGTLNETIEMITWRQLGQHERPVLIAT